MEYEFKKDFINQQPIATFSFGHEAFGPWIEQEIGKETDKLDQVLAFVVDNTTASKTGEKTLIGSEYTLSIYNDEIEVKANLNSIETELPENMLEDFDDFEQTSEASCGLEDFILMLESWSEFINNK